MAQRKDVCLFAGVGIAEDGVGKELCRVRMHEIAALLACHQEIGIGIGFHLRDDLGEVDQ